MLFPRYATKNHTKQTCAIGVTYCYELLDQYVGQMAAMNVPHDHRHANELCAPPDTVPMNARFLAAILDSGACPTGRVREFIRAMAQHDEYSGYGDIDNLEDDAHVRSIVFNFWRDFIDRDLSLRGFREGRRYTLRQRLYAVYKLIEAHAGRVMVNVDGTMRRPRIEKKDWDLLRTFYLPPQSWSAEQQELLDAIREGISQDDGSNFHRMDSIVHRCIHVCGEPGSGKNGSYHLRRR